MQPTLCSRCKKNVAVVFISKLDGERTINEGLCLKCAKELGLPQVDDMMKRMGISDEDLETLNSEMMQAMKKKDKPRKDSLSMLLAALKNKAIDKREDLTEAEENEVILKEIKQTQETLDLTPADRTDIIEECQGRIAVYQEFAPKMMDEEEIRVVIQEVLKELGIETPTNKDKGKIMKQLMPQVKGKADGKLVNQVLGSMMG